MQYSIKHTTPYMLFGLNPIQIDGWETQRFLEYADKVIEDGAHDIIDRSSPLNLIKQINKRKNIDINGHREVFIFIYAAVSNKARYSIEAKPSSRF